MRCVQEHRIRNEALEHDKASVLERSRRFTARANAHTPDTAAEANSCRPLSPSKAVSLLEVSEPSPQTIAVLLSAVVAMGDPPPPWTAHQATSHRGGLPGMILAGAELTVSGSLLAMQNPGGSVVCRHFEHKLISHSRCTEGHV